MSESNKKDISHLGTKIVNMLDEIIKCDDDIETTPMRSSLKFSDDSSYSDEEKENAGELFDKDIFSNIFSPIEEQNQNQKKSNRNNPNLAHINIQNNINQSNQNQFNSIFNNTNNNYNNFYYNHLFSPQMNNLNNLNNFNFNNNPYIYPQPGFNMLNNNNNINMISNLNSNYNYNMNLNNNNNNNFQRKNSESMNSVSTLNDKTTKPSDNMSFYSIDMNNIHRNSFMNNQNFDNSFYKENFMHKFKRRGKIIIHFLQEIKLYSIPIL